MKDKRVILFEPPRGADPMEDALRKLRLAGHTVDRIESQVDGLEVFDCVYADEEASTSEAHPKPGSDDADERDQDEHQHG